MSRIDDILGRIEGLEKELSEEFREREERLRQDLRDRKQRFSEEVREHHRELAQKLSTYVYDSGVFIVLTVPIIWGALIPAALLDAFVWLYQLTCFPVYGIPRVRRKDYIVIDRHELEYLNGLEKLNCIYCGYFNGLMAYVREVAGRTEQYWCPVRHGRHAKDVHGRYRHFFAYGDADAYREGLADVRRKWDDVR